MYESVKFPLRAPGAGRFSLQTDKKVQHAIIVIKNEYENCSSYSQYRLPSMFK